MSKMLELLQALHNVIDTKEREFNSKKENARCVF